MTEPLRKVTEFVGYHAIIPNEGHWMRTVNEDGFEGYLSLRDLLPGETIDQMRGRFRVTVELVRDGDG